MSQLDRLRNITTWLKVWLQRSGPDKLLQDILYLRAQGQASDHDTAKLDNGRNIHAQFAL